MSTAIHRRAHESANSNTTLKTTENYFQKKTQEMAEKEGWVSDGLHHHQEDCYEQSSK